ncbi:MAG TPA: TonB-dependent receptor [Flavobacteriaceae bacterium]|nr:TonB-dependent receptor [Flavobacteriaceae bacterium]
MQKIFIGLLFLWSCMIFGQKCQNSFTGKIIDYHDNSALAGATIILIGSEKALMSDLDGKFSIEGLCDGNYKLQISHPECLTRIVSISVNGDTSKEIYLEHHIVELEKVVIREKAHKNSLESLAESNLSSEEIARHSAGSLGDALKEISGVSALNTGNTISKPIIQGLHGSRILIMNHGVRMESQEWGAEHAPNVDINSANAISVIKGAAALQYGGDAIGGMIKMMPKSIAKTDSLYGKTLFTAATNGRGTSTTTSLTKSYKNGWYATVQGTLKRFGDFETPDYILSNTGFGEKDASIRAGFDTYLHGLEVFYSYYHTELGILSASHLGGIEDQLRALNSDRPLIVRDFTYAIDAPKQEVTHQLAKVSYFKRFKDFGKLSLQYDFQKNHRLEFDRRRNSNENSRAAIDLLLNTHNFSADMKFDNHSSLEGKAGFNARFQENSSDPDTGVKRLIPDYTKTDFGVYAMTSYAFSPNFTIEAGGRYDYSYLNAYKYYQKSLWENRDYDKLFPEFIVEDFETQLLAHPTFTFHAFSGTAGLHYDFSENWELLANYSLASRIPNPSELFSEGLHHSAARIEIGDLRFEKEIANKFSVNLQKKSSKFRFSLNAYVNNIKNFIVLEPVEIQQTIRGSFQVWEYRQTNAQMLGLDFDASLKIMENLRFENRFSIVKGNDRSFDKALINMPPAYLVNGLHYSNEGLGNLEISLESKTVFEQNEYPDNRFTVFVPTTQTTERVDLSTPPAAYHLLNFRIGTDLFKTKDYKTRINLSVQNVLDRSYRDYLNRQRYYADNLGRNFTLQLTFKY